MATKEGLRFLIEPLGADEIDLDNPRHVDWLYRRAQEADKLIDELEKRNFFLAKQLDTANRIAEDYKEKWHRAIDSWEKKTAALETATLVRVEKLEASTKALEERLAIREKGTL